jgi:hypothetical protein
MRTAPVLVLDAGPEQRDTALRTVSDTGCQVRRRVKTVVV